eukprot:scaffold108591_cov45-Attheya_sp.AAC.3
MIPVRLSSSSLLLFFFFFSVINIISPFVCVAFSPSNPSQHEFHKIRPKCIDKTSSTWLLAARRHNPNNNNEDETNEDNVPIPQLALPAMGGSSFSSDPSSRSTSMSSTTEEAETTTSASSPPAFARQKFELQYTCKVCDTRNSNRVSRIGTYSHILSLSIHLSVIQIPKHTF